MIWQTRFRRAVTGYVLAGTIGLLAATAHAANTAIEVVGLSKVQSVLPHLDGVDPSGAVQRVAVLDTGIDYDHPGLGNRVIGGVNYAADAPWGSTNPDDWDDRHGHGTFASGIVGSASAELPGVLPQVEFVSVRVLSASGSGSFSDVVSGLNWVADHARELNITAVNLSLGSAALFTEPRDVPQWSVTQSLVDALGRLEQDNIVNVVASGNDGSATSMAMPAIFEQVVSVGATDSSDGMWSLTNRNEHLELLAPGTGLTSLWKNGRTASGTGTSFAAPWVTGATVLLREAYMQFTDDLAGDYHSFQDRVTALLQASGDPVYDASSGLTYSRLNLVNAINMVYEEFGQAQPIPEPATLALVGSGLMLMAYPHRRRAMRQR